MAEDSHRKISRLRARIDALKIAGVNLPFLRINAEGAITLASPAFAQLLGLNESELIGREVKDHAFRAVKTTLEQVENLRLLREDFRKNEKEKPV